MILSSALRKLRTEPFQLQRNARYYRVLAIESSCDDSAICILRREPDQVVLEAHEKVTLDSTKYGGIVPADAFAHHLRCIAPTISRMLDLARRPQIDLVCATSGPGMYSSLAAGLQVGKGLALGWNVPFIPVHHMLGHLLTPRALSSGKAPGYPFMSLLISGGHTMLVLSRSLYDHKILANSLDIAAGDALDKCARQLGMRGVMLGKELDKFTKDPKLGPLPDNFTVSLPLEKKSQLTRAKYLSFGFAHFESVFPQAEKKYGFVLNEQQESVRRHFGIKMQEAIFEHVGRKIELVLEDEIRQGKISRGQRLDFVCSGGVAANSFLRARIQALDADLDIKFHFVDPKWCTDNALMIAWAGIELFEAGESPDLGAVPRAKWPLDQLEQSVRI